MEDTTVAFILSLMGGIFDVAVAIFIIASASLIEGLDYGHVAMWARWGIDVPMTVWGGIGLSLAILIIIGAFLIRMPRKEVIGSMLVIVFSIVNFFVTAGGMYIGTILGLIGGLLGFASTRPHY